MLKFLTHKLRTHSLNEENVSEKVEEHDSGTESDDEADRADSGDLNTDVIMKWNDGADISMTGEACACGPTPARLLPEPEPDHLYDHHSSEEELELKMGGAGVSGVGSVGRMGSVGRVGGVRSWRAVGGAHAGELSVFCW